jgi:hypothetical protein
MCLMTFQNTLAALHVSLHTCQLSQILKIKVL